jgi:Uma2 family endonuclease
MALAPTIIRLSPEVYLEGENRSDVKHEYDNGYVVAMVGASRSHNLIALTLASAIKLHTKGSPCRTYMSDMKVRIQTQGNDLFYYPDIMVSCDDTPPSEYYEDKPVFIIEVLSPSTETRDKLEKLSAYSSIPSLVEYFTVAQDKVEVHRYSVVEGNAVLTKYYDGDTVEISSIGLTIPVKDIYSDVAGKLFND